MKSLLRHSSLLITVVLFLCVCSSRRSGHVVEAASVVSSPVDIGSEEPGVPASPAMSEVVIPGPLRSFLRMAGISQKISPGQVLPLLSRNVSLNGYDQGKPTEFLILIDRYLQQARELQVLAGPSNKITVSSCDDA